MDEQEIVFFQIVSINVSSTTMKWELLTIALFLSPRNRTLCTPFNLAGAVGCLLICNCIILGMYVYTGEYKTIDFIL